MKTIGTFDLIGIFDAIINIFMSIYGYNMTNMLYDYNMSLESLNI